MLGRKCQGRRAPRKNNMKRDCMNLTIPDNRYMIYM